MIRTIVFFGLFSLAACSDSDLKPFVNPEPPPKDYFVGEWLRNDSTVYVFTEDTVYRKIWGNEIVELWESGPYSLGWINRNYNLIMTFPPAEHVNLLGWTENKFWSEDKSFTRND